MWWSKSLDASGIAHLRQRRLNALVAHARTHSPLYAHLYRGLPESPTTPDLRTLPVVRRPELMRHFDDWVTDRRVTREDLQHFIADPERVGELYLDRYVVWSSSGSTGMPGLYVQDENAMAVYEALSAARLNAHALRSMSAWPVDDGPLVLITATGGHFASVVWWQRLRRTYAWPENRMRTLSVLQPLHELVAQLNAWQPATLASYPTTLALLAQEQSAGRLRIAPRALFSGGENLGDGNRALIARSFGQPVIDAYGASECLCIAFECDRGTLHLNDDWVLLEPVDARGRIVPQGEASHSVLLTNLANHVQPLIRYDLGDSITMLPRCDCGSGLQALRVDGRCDDIVSLRSRDGSSVSLLPLALATVVEEASGVQRFQLRQTGPTSLRVSFACDDGRPPVTVWRLIHRALAEYRKRPANPS